MFILTGLRPWCATPPTGANWPGSPGACPRRRSMDIPVILAGDYNIIPIKRDVYNPDRWRDDALFLPQVRKAYAALLKQGWHDAIGTIHSDKPVYTFWDYLRHAWERNAGLRLDHLLLSPESAPRLKNAGVDRDIRGRSKASDHAPAWIVLDTA